MCIKKPFKSTRQAQRIGDTADRLMRVPHYLGVYVEPFIERSIPSTTGDRTRLK